MSNVYEARGLDTVQKCKICNGAGVIPTSSSYNLPCKDPDRKVSLLVHVPCICKKNEVVERRYASMHPRVTPSIVNQTLIDEVVRKYKPLSKSYVFSGSLDSFNKIVKAVLVNYSFQEYQFHISNGIEVVQEYYVEQPEGVERTLQDLIYNRDLLIIKFDTHVENKALKNVMLDLIGGRCNHKRPTWIWCQSTVESTVEYTQPMASFLESFDRINLGGKAPARRDRSNDLSLRTIENAAKSMESLKDQEKEEPEELGTVTSIAEEIPPVPAKKRTARYR